MGKIISNPKDYAGRELEEIFFRPLLTGPGAQELGLRILYNMPVPTKLNFWKRAINILTKYKKGWQGGEIAEKFQKQITLEKVKAEMGYSAEDYFGMIYEIITNRSDINLDDLKGTDLANAEEYLFREALRESIRVEMWLGDTSRPDYDPVAKTGGFNSINGLLGKIIGDVGTDENSVQSFTMPSMGGIDAAEGLFKMQYRQGKSILKQFKSELVYFVTDDVLENYEDTLTSANLESARSAMINGVKTYFWNGIPIIPVKLGDYLPLFDNMPQSFSILTPAKNLAIAVNLKDFPDNTEIRFWYNPDEMENRQRAIFMMGTDYLLPELTNIAYSETEEL